MNNYPIRRWNYCFEFATIIKSVITSIKVGMNHWTTFKVVMGYILDILELTLYFWYQWIWFWNPTDFQTQKLGRWRGVANNVGSGYT